MAPSHMQNYYYNTTDDENDVVNYYNNVVYEDESEDEYQEDEKEEIEAKTKTRTKNNDIVFNGSSSSRCSSFSLSRVILDPRGKWIEEWNRIFLLLYIEKRSSFGFVHRTTRPRTSSSHVFPYFKSNKGFFFDIFVILPLPQISGSATGVSEVQILFLTN
ncbi:cyclic nucleotide-gated ion channel-like protein [Trifolium pratense]|uniref:Cyclic nucleotide-gated ion channel-like protein n=1 Tax=Trifolium pratense TaxID=57577 RepID=A0A2K3MNQ4_TRIPR|nr:cyclic nucleotide-gated ion channel-like protein [Trifolium pratense]